MFTYDITFEHYYSIDTRAGWVTIPADWLPDEATLNDAAEYLEGEPYAPHFQKGKPTRLRKRFGALLRTEFNFSSHEIQAFEKERDALEYILDMYADYDDEEWAIRAREQLAACDEQATV